MTTEGYVCKTWFDFEYPAGYPMDVYPDVETMKEKCRCCLSCGYYRIQITIVAEVHGTDEA